MISHIIWLWKHMKYLPSWVTLTYFENVTSPIRCISVSCCHTVVQEISYSFSTISHSINILKFVIIHILKRGSRTKGLNMMSSNAQSGLNREKHKIYWIVCIVNSERVIIMFIVKFVFHHIQPIIILIYSPNDVLDMMHKWRLHLRGKDLPIF